VNPIVAVFLGWLLAGEPFTMRMALATVVIIGGVLLVTRDAGTATSHEPVIEGPAEAAAA
jgi:drug/metabolite transporter (DMT)-like permease